MKRILRTVFCITLAVFIIAADAMPASTAAVDSSLQERAGTGKQAVYTEATKPNSDTSGDGTKSNPYNRFQDALANVADGGTIYILSRGAFINILDEYGNLPYVINKSVTIRAEGSGQASLTVRAAGLIMDGDVTFENIALGFENKYHSAIFANGHNLILNNVSRESGSRLVHVFAGGLHAKQGNGTGWYGAAPTGGGSIVISGEKTELGNIYAGAMNSPHNGNVSLSVSGANSMKIGDVYASGAHEPDVDLGNWFDMSEPPDPEADADNFTVSGRVSITLRNTPIRNVNGFGANDGSSVDFFSNYENSYIKLSGIEDLTVSGGTLKPAVLTSPRQDGSFGIISAAQGAALDLSGNVAVTADEFRGGGTLILERNGELTVSKNLEGITAFETEGGFGGKSGFAIGGHPYIKAPAESSGSFTFAPAVSQQGSTIKSEVSGGQEIWSIELGNNSPSVVTSLSCDEPEKTVYKGELNRTSGDDLGASFYIDVEKNDDRMLAFEYAVKYNGEEQNAEKSSEVEVAVVKTLNMSVFVTEASYVDEYDLCIEPILDEYGELTGEIPSGFYEITISAPSVSGEISLTVYLTVLPDLEEPDESKAASRIALDLTQAEGAAFGDTVTFASDVMGESGEALSDGTVKYYVNGNCIGEAASNADCEIQINEANGFKIGNNSVTAAFSGSDTHNASASEAAALTVKKAAPQIMLNSGSSAAVTAVYDGLGHPINEGVVSVSASGAPNTEVSFSISYAYEKEEKESGVPVIAGSYAVIVSAEETEYSTAGVRRFENAVKIERAAAKVTLEQQKGADGKAQIVVTVSGETGSTGTPAGSVTLLRDGMSLGEVQPLHFGQTVFGLGDWTGTANFSAEYSTDRVERPCYTNAVSETVSITVTADSGSESGGETGGGSESGGNTGGSGGGGSAGGGASQPDTSENENKEDLNSDVKSASEKFSDVKAGSWYESAVTFAVNNGLFKGVADGRFDPDGSMSRAMIMTVLARMNGRDVDGASPWYEKSLAWAVEAGVSDGANPNENITREQLVTMMYRYAGTPEADADLTVFADYEEVSSWAEPAMKWAVSNEIVKGDSSMRILSSANATRAEAAAIFERFAKLQEK